MAFRILQQAFKNLRCRTFLTFRKHPQTIDKIGDHVKRQSYHHQPNYFMLYNDGSEEIERDHIF